MTPDLMGILNITPDSFSGDGLFSAHFIDDALKKAERFLKEGACWLDIGGESTRPGFTPVSIEEELRRVVPVVEAIRKEFPDALLSVDTTKSKVAFECLSLGIHMINDVSGCLKDPEMIKGIAKSSVYVVPMHASKKPYEGEQVCQVSQDVFDAFWVTFLFQMQEIVTRLASFGIAKERLILDPGIGFGTCLTENLLILKGLEKLASLGLPVLVGASRKSFIGKITDSVVENRLGGSLAVALFAAQKGCSILRVHDVLETKQCLDMWHALEHFA